MSSQLNVGIAGLGAIGRVVARKIQTGALPRITLAGVTTGDRVKAQSFLDEIGSAAPVLDIQNLAALSDAVVECAPAAVFAEIAVPVLSAGKKLIALSAGQLLRHPELIALAKESGGQIIVQDEASSVVWGMPGAVVRAGLADSVLPLEQIAEAAVHRSAIARRRISAADRGRQSD